LKKLSFFSKIIVICNFIVALLLLLTYVVPYIPPKSFPVISVLSLAFPILILVNVVFMLYWVFRLKRFIWISGVVLILGLTHVNKLYQFSGKSSVSQDPSITVMNYNVRLFNLYNWIKNPSVKEDILSIVKTTKPDIIGIQEYHDGAYKDFKKLYPYAYKAINRKSDKAGQAIFTRFKIINQGQLYFKNTLNNILFIDIINQADTIRVYNCHLQSSGINPEGNMIGKNASKALFKNVSKTFQRQQEQVAKFNAHIAKCQYKTIVMGDFNNTAFSYTYNQMRNDLNDTFVEAGKGFGKTFDFKLFPMRIDFILADPDFEVHNFKTLKVKLSDHYPIMAKLSLNK